MAVEKAGEFKIFDCKLTQAEFQKLSSFIYDELGIKLPDMKKVMLESRLQRRLRDLGMTNFKDYIDFLFSKDGRQNEMVHMFDVVTTNKTASDAGDNYSIPLPDKGRTDPNFYIVTDVNIKNILVEKIGLKKASGSVNRSSCRRHSDPRPHDG